MNILKAAVASKTARLGAVLGVAAAALIAVAPGSDAATVTAVATPATTGPGTPVITLTTPTATFRDAAGALLASGGTYFDTATTCTAIGSKGSGTSVVAGSASYLLGGVKAVVTAPTLTAGTMTTPKAYMICVYDGSGVIASTSVKVYPAPTISAIVKTKGSVSGGETVTVTGTNFSAKTTATLGGTAVTGLKLATGSTTAFTAVAPAHAAGSVALVVTTEGGSATSAGAYTYANSVTVSPTTAKHGVLTTLDITGKGFTSIASWSAAVSSIAPASTAVGHVYLVKGLYDNTDNSGAKTNAQSLECVHVQVVSDTELTCDMTTTTRVADDGAYTVAIVDNGAVGATLAFSTVVSSTATFTIGDF